MEPLVILVIVLALYFLPTILALDRKHNNKLAIFFLNLFLGWTLVGWVWAFVWACTNDRKIDTSSTHTKCPECAEPVLREAKKCRHCGCSLPEPGDNIKWLKQTEETPQVATFIPRSLPPEAGSSSRHFKLHRGVTAAVIATLVIVVGAVSAFMETQQAEATARGEAEYNRLFGSNQVKPPQTR